MSDRDTIREMLTRAGIEFNEDRWEITVKRASMANVSVQFFFRDSGELESVASDEVDYD